MSEKLEFKTIIRKRNRITIPEPFKENDAVKVIITKLEEPKNK